MAIFFVSDHWMYNKSSDLWAHFKDHEIKAEMNL